MVSRYMPGDMPIPQAPYRLIQLLGEGGFGQVWKCQGPGGTACAMKIIALDSQGFKEYRAIRRVKLIKHPNLVPIQAIWLKDGYDNLLDEESAGSSMLASSKASELIIAMGLGERSLSDRLNECRQQGKIGIPARELIGYMKDAAKALEYLNFPTEAGRSSIRHGDIKPGNMLIVGGSGLQVCDFGLAEVLAGNDISITVTKRKAFTPAYMAPELIQGQGNQLSDMFSLAISYFELRTGDLPFKAMSPEHAMILIASRQFDFSAIQNDLERAVIEQAMSAQPQERFPNYIEFADALEDALHDEIRPARRASPSSGDFRAVPSNPELRPPSVPDFRAIPPDKHRVAPDTRRPASVPQMPPVPSMRVRKPVPLTDLLRPNVEIVPNHRLKNHRSDAGPEGGQVWAAFNPQGKPVALEILGELPNGPRFDPRAVVAKLEGGHRSYWLLNEFGDQLRVSDLSDAEVTCQAVVINQSVPLTELVAPGREPVPGYRLKQLTTDPGRYQGIVYEATDPQGRQCFLEVFGDAPGLKPLKPELIDKLREHNRTFWLINDFGQPVRRADLGRPDLMLLGAVILQKTTLADLLQPGRELVPHHVLKEKEPELGRHNGVVWEAVAPGGKLCGLEILGDDGSGNFRPAEVLEKLRKEGILRPGAVWLIDPTGKPYSPGSTDKVNTEPVAVVVKQRADLSRMLIPNRELVPSYTLKKKLGQGGYGQVWEAVGPGKRPCALKIVNLSGNQGRQELRSLRLMRELDNAHLLELQICWLLDEFGEVIPEEQWDNPGGITSATLIVGTKLAAMNLLDKLGECQRGGHRGIPAADLLRYMRQAADAIDYLNAEIHELDGKKISIIHRDIKPENILLTRNDEVMVSDFGLAKVMEGGRGHINTDSRGFTVYYAAPEVLTRDDVTRTSDQYSLAVTYFQLRVGELPFDRRAPAIQLMIQLGEGRLDLDALDDEDERDVVARATHKDPDERYASCGEFVAELARVLQVSMSELQMPPLVRSGLSNADVHMAVSGTKTGSGLPHTDPMSASASPAARAASSGTAPVAVAEAAQRAWGGQTIGPDGLNPSDTPPSVPVPPKSGGKPPIDRSVMLNELNISQTIIPDAHMRPAVPHMPMGPVSPVPAAKADGGPGSKRKVNVPAAPPSEPDPVPWKPKAYDETQRTGPGSKPNLVARLKPGMKLVNFELREQVAGGDKRAVWTALDANGRPAKLKIYTELGGIGWRLRAEKQYPEVAAALKREESLSPKAARRVAYVLDRRDNPQPRIEWSDAAASAESVIVAEGKGGGGAGRVVMGIVGAMVLVVGGWYGAEHWGKAEGKGHVTPVVPGDDPDNKVVVNPPPIDPQPVKPAIEDLVQKIEERFHDSSENKQAIVADIEKLDQQEISRNPQLVNTTTSIKLLARSAYEPRVALTDSDREAFEKLFKSEHSISKYVPLLAMDYLQRIEISRGDAKATRSALAVLPKLPANSDAKILADYLTAVSDAGDGNKSEIVGKFEDLYKVPTPSILQDGTRRERSLAVLDAVVAELWKPLPDNIAPPRPYQSYDESLLLRTFQLAERIGGRTNPRRSARMCIVMANQKNPKTDELLNRFRAISDDEVAKLAADQPNFLLARADLYAHHGNESEKRIAFDEYDRVIRRLQTNAVNRSDDRKAAIEKILTPAIQAIEPVVMATKSKGYTDKLADWLGVRAELRMESKNYAESYADFKQARVHAKDAKHTAQLIAGQRLAFKLCSIKPSDSVEFQNSLMSDADKAVRGDPSNYRVMALIASAKADDASKQPKLNDRQNANANRLYQEALNLYKSLLSKPIDNECEHVIYLIDAINLARHLRTQWVDPDNNKKLSEDYLKQAESYKSINNADVYYRLGLAYEESAWLDGVKNQYPVAVNTFDKAIDLDDTRPEYYISRSRTKYRWYLYGGGSEDTLRSAEIDLQDVLSVLDKPDAKPIQRGEANLYYADILAIKNRFMDADKHYTLAYNNLKDNSIGWIKMAYYAKARAGLDFIHRDKQGEVASKQKIDKPTEYLEEVANHYQRNHKMEFEADWLRGKVLSISKEGYADAASKFARYLTPSFPDDLAAFSPTLPSEWPSALARLRFLVEWMYLHLEDTKLTGNSKLSASKLEEIANCIVNLGTSSYNQEIELKARSLAVAGLALNSAAGKLPLSNSDKKQELRARAKTLMMQATELVCDKCPGAWEWLDRVKQPK